MTTVRGKNTDLFLNLALYACTFANGLGRAKWGRHQENVISSYTGHRKRYTATLVPTDQSTRNTSQRSESAVYKQAVPYPFAQRVFLPHSKGHSSQITAATDSPSLSLSLSPSHGSNVINQPAPSNSLVLVQFVFRDSPHCVVITSISDLHYTYEQYEIKKETEWTCRHARRPTPTDLQRKSLRKRICSSIRPTIIPTLIRRIGMW